jgi:hypothetical protein
MGLGALIGGIVAALALGPRRLSALAADLEGRADWPRRRLPSARKLCYRSKGDALRVFEDWNRRVIENYGGLDVQVSPAEFDAVNARYGLTGKRAARSIAEALWEAMPARGPFCLDQIDLEALNGTSPAREADEKLGIKFELPDFALEQQHARQQAELEPEVEPAPRPPRAPPKPKEAPGDWRGRCAAWKRRDLEARKARADDCFQIRRGEQCVCRKGGRFAPCTPPAAEVPF